MNVVKEREREGLLGEGGYGCVFLPEIPCVHDVEYLNPRSTGTQVSKIFTYTDASFTREVDVARKIKEWDSTGEYFLLPTKACKTTPALVKKNREVKKCEGFKDVEKNRYINQMVMPYGGVDVYTFLRDYYFHNHRKFPLAVWIRLLENVLEGLVVLKKHKITHMDIKAENTIFDGKKIKLFDFGLAKPFHDVYTHMNVRRLSNHYFVYPPEFLMVAKLLEPENNGRVIHNLYYDFMQTLYSFESAVRENLYTYHPLKEIIREIKSLEGWTKKEDWVKKVSLHADKVDIYSVGVMCIDMERFLDYSQVPYTAQKLYRTLVRKMTEIDFRKRIDIEGAMVYYHRVVDEL